MKTLFRGALLSLVVVFAAAPAPALPPDCSYSLCRNNPDRLCAVPGTAHVMFCSEWL